MGGRERESLHQRRIGLMGNNSARVPLFGGSFTVQLPTKSTAALLLPTDVLSQA